MTESAVTNLENIVAFDEHVGTISFVKANTVVQRRNDIKDVCCDVQNIFSCTVTFDLYFSTVLIFGAGKRYSSKNAGGKMQGCWCHSSIEFLLRNHLLFSSPECQSRTTILQVAVLFLIDTLGTRHWGRCFDPGRNRLSTRSMTSYIF